MPLLLTLVACSSEPSGSTPESEAGPLPRESYGADAPQPGDAALAKQAGRFRTVGLADDWNNLEGFFDAFCDEYELGCAGSGAGPNRFDSSLGGSARSIAAFSSEKSDPPLCADIGIGFGQVAEEQGSSIRYLPEAAADLAAPYRAETGGWVAYLTGAMSIVVNTDVVSDPPQTWQDLKKPEYKGLLSTYDPTTSGTAQMMIVATAAALSEDSAELDLDAAFEFWRELRELGQFNGAELSLAAMERGETPMAILYDYTGLNQARQINDKAGYEKVKVIIPDDGGVWAPSAIVCNAHSDKPELAKAVLDFLLSERGQLVFAEFGARPIRDDLQIPEEMQARMIPDSEYADIVDVPGGGWPDPALIAERWEDEVLG